MALKAISIALDHPQLSTDPQVLCRVAAVCKGWRQAVQQCCTCNTHISLESVTLQKLASLTAWLPRHAALVESIGISQNQKPSRSSYRALDSKEYTQQVVRLLQPAVQLAALLPATAVPGRTGAAGASQAAACRLSQQQQQQQQWQRGLHLASFSCKAPGGTGLLGLLPPHSLTELVFGEPAATGATSIVNGPALTAAIARLSNLRRLHLVNTYGFRTPACSLAAAAEFTKLTYLELEGGGEMQNSRCSSC
jgi:hypothetical protein